MFGIRPEAAEFFKPYFQSGTDDSILFRYGSAAFESWKTGLHLIPSTSEVWLAGAGHPNLVTDLYIGYSAADLICFASQRSFGLLKLPGQQAFAALGLLPSCQQVCFLKSMFPFARWHLVFDADLLGKLADAAVAVWLKGKLVSFRYAGNRIIAVYRRRIFYFESDSFSLNRFELATGLRAGIRTHKPPHDLLSFTALQNILQDDS